MSSKSNCRIGAIVLAAGQSARMGSVNKLLVEYLGKPVLRHVVEAVLESKVHMVIVVTGHEYEKVAVSLSGLAVTIVRNRDYASGLSSSLHCGLSATQIELDGFLICLGDMPCVTPSVIDTLIAAFKPAEGRSICVPTWHGQRGNPVLLARRFLPEMQALSGDVGAKELIAKNEEVVAEVAMADDAVLTDVDTPEKLATLKATDDP